MVKRLMKLSLVALLFTACAYEASFDNDCTISCTVDTGCPDGLTCGPEGMCRAPEDDVCVLPTDGTGGTITHVGGRTIHTFLAEQSGSSFMAPPDVSEIELLVVAGGGGGGSTRGGGGGGAGGVVYMAAFTNDQPAYGVIVGYGGPSSTKGGDSSFGTTVATTGGGAGTPSSSPNGGSGGGADHGGTPSGAGISGQGSNGGAAGWFNAALTAFTGAGGGGAGAIGAVGAPNAGGSGGSGFAYMTSGTLIYYAGGGGGGAEDLGDNGLSASLGGVGGGGTGGFNEVGGNAVDGTGGGGGGGGHFLAGGRGGNGVVIVSYPTVYDSPRSDAKPSSPNGHAKKIGILNEAEEPRSKALIEDTIKGLKR